MLNIDYISDTFRIIVVFFADTFLMAIIQNMHKFGKLENLIKVFVLKIIERILEQTNISQKNVS